MTLVAECGVPTRIAVRVEFPPDYPDTEPRIYDDADAFPHEPDRHFYPDGQCCLWLPPESRWDPDDPDGLLAFLEEVAVFLDRQLVCDAMGGWTWPGPARSHGFIGYVEFVRDLLAGDDALVAALAPVFAGQVSPGRNDQCPCGGGRKYKKCHLRAVEAVAQRVGVRRLRQVFGKYLAHAIDTDKMRDPIDQPGS
jgi:SEC-C motif